MDKQSILDRYFNAFIAQENTRDFFLGLADYLDYGETLPEFDWITSDVSSKPQPLYQKLKEQEVVAIKKLNHSKKELQAYIEKNKLDDRATLEELRNYEALISVPPHRSSSLPLPLALHNDLVNVVQFLWEAPDHRQFATKYIEFQDKEKTRLRRFLPMQEVDDYRKTQGELQRGHDFDIWGQQARVYELYDIIRKGRERNEELAKAHREGGSVSITHSLLGLGLILGEWIAIEEGRSDRNPTFFSVKKMRPVAQRFHTYVLSRFATAHDALQQGKVKQEKSDVISFNPALGVLSVQGKSIKFRKFTEQYHTLTPIFSKPEELEKEWFFSELAEKIDTAKKYTDKNFHNYFSAIKRRIAADTGIKDLFITTTQSVKINDDYLK